MGGRCAADDDEKARERTGECEHSVFGGATTKRSSSSEGGREIGREERKKASKISISLPPSLPPSLPSFARSNLRLSASAT